MWSHSLIRGSRIQSEDCSNSIKIKSSDLLRAKKIFIRKAYGPHQYNWIQVE